MCFCEAGWGGETCELPLGGAPPKRCLNDCHAHGFCDPVLGLCRCLRGRGGAAAEIVLACAERAPVMTQWNL